MQSRHLRPSGMEAIARRTHPRSTAPRRRGTTPCHGPKSRPLPAPVAAARPAAPPVLGGEGAARLAGGSAGASLPSTGIVVAILLLILILVLVLVVRGLEG
jgi:hypothetical protein